MLKMTLQCNGYCRHLRFVLLCQLMFFTINTTATLEAAAGAAAFLKQQPLTHAFETAMHNIKDDNIVVDNEVELPTGVEEQYVDVEQLDAKQQEREQQQQQLALAATFPDAATARLFEMLHNEQEHHQQHQQQQHQQQHRQKATTDNSDDMFNHHQKQQQQQEQQQKQQQKQQQQQQSQQHYRYCTIEITTKVPGTCQPMKPIGSACVSGEYMDVFNLDCM